MDAHYKKWVVEEKERMANLQLMKDEAETKASEAEEEAEVEAMHDEETRKLREAAQALQDKFSQGGSGTSSKQINMGDQENINDIYGFQKTAASGGEASDEDDQAPGMLKVYKEGEKVEEEVDEEIDTGDIKFKAPEDQSSGPGEKPLI